VTDVALWGYGFASLAFLLFALYVFFAWRGGLPGGALLVAVVLSCLWAGTEAASVRVSGATLPVVGVVLDILRGAAWFGFLIVLMRPLW
jgi:hypothetical protein